MSSGLYSGVSGLALGVGLYKGVSGLWSGATGFDAGFAGSSPFSGASLALDFLSGAPLDSRITFTRGSNATLVDSTGKVTYAPANLLTYSQDFDNAAWTKSNVTVTANSGVAPDGTTTADLLVDPATAAQHYISQPFTTVSGTTYTISFYAKNNGNGQCIYTWSSGASAFPSGNATFNLVTGAATTTVGSAAMTAVGNGWYRCTATSTATASVVGAVYYLSLNGLGSYTGSGTGGVFIWGAQLEPVTYQTTPGTYNATTASAYYGPRFDYDPVTLAAKGLLIEEARTNLLTYSSDWANVAWAKTNITVTAAATASPDGTTNGQKLEATATAATALNSTPVAVAATSATYSVYVKQGTGPTTANTFFLRNNTTATLLVGGTLNFATGVFSYIIGSTGATVTNAGNGWWRIQLTATTGITSGDALHGYVGWSGAVATAGDFLYAYGAQLEAGSFATSYIPTVASQVTRSADVATMTGTNFSSWYNQTAGTFVVSADTAKPTTLAAVSEITSANDNTTNNRITTRFASSTVDGVVVVSGAAVAAISTAYTAGAVTKIALGSAANDFAFAVAGSLIGTDTAGAMPAVTKLDIGNLTGFNFLNGHIRQIAYYNTRLSDAQLQALTT